MSRKALGKHPSPRVPRLIKELSLNISIYIFSEVLLYFGLLHKIEVLPLCHVTLQYTESLADDPIPCN